MELSKKQEEGLQIILNRHKQHEKYTVVSGFALLDKTIEFDKIQLSHFDI